MLPAIRLVSKLGRPEPLCDHFDYSMIERMARPGDVLLSKEYWRLSNLLIPGRFSHAAIVLDNGLVLEAVPPRTRVVSLGQFVYSKDEVALVRAGWPLRFENISDEYLQRDGRDVGYDFEFCSGNPAWYCSELVWDYLRRITVGEFPLVLKTKLGIQTIEPDDFERSIAFGHIYDSKFWRGKR